MMLRANYFLALFLSIAAVSAQDPFADSFNLNEETTATVRPQATKVEPGFYFRVAFTLNLQEHYHAYYKNAGTVGDPPSVKWDLPKGFEVGELRGWIWAESTPDT